jgi:hypothetical protein
VPPTPPADLAAAPGGSGGIDLSWTTAVDDVGVTGYRIIRDGSPLAATGPVGSYHDATAAPGATHTYEVTAVDDADGESLPSNAATGTAPPAIFADGFETGDLSRWSASSGMVVQQQEVAAGTWAARATTTGGPGRWARRVLDAPRTELVATARFKILGRTSAANLLTFQTPAGGGLAKVYLGAGGNIAVRNAVAARTFASSVVPTGGEWHEIRFRISVAGGSSQVEVWLDGTRVDAASKVTSLGSTGAGRLILGESTSGTRFDIAFDAVELST